jgi:peptidoglycan/xylan/chitin deacetylase (PgdA/CDA1 family)
VTGVNVRFQDKGNAAPITVRVAAVELIPDLGATYPNGVFIMEADDGYAGQFTNLLPVVSARGVPVTYNIISARFTGASTPSGYTPADLRRAQDKYGWQVSCHAYAQADHDGPSTAGQMEASFQRQKHWLHANGLHAGVDHLALCPGTGSPVPEGPMMDAIRRSFRSARVNAGFYETAAPGDSLRLRSILFSGAGNSVANLQTNINAVAGAGGALIFTVHDILAGATDGTSNSLPAQAATNLATVLDYAASKGMTFRTRADWLDGR